MMITWGLAVIAVVFLCLFVRERIINRRLSREILDLRSQIEDLAKRIVELESRGKSDKTISKEIVATLVALGAPSLILITAVATSGFVGAAAITSSLALFGGPFGMLGGVAAFVVIGLIAKEIAKYGYEPLVLPVYRGLVAKGESFASVSKLLEAAPRWAVPPKVRNKLLDVIQSEDSGGTAKNS